MILTDEQPGETLETVRQIVSASSGRLKACPKGWLALPMPLGS